MSTTTDTSWIVPGAEVVVFSNDHRYPRARRDRIEKIAKKSFTVEDGQPGERYQLKDACRRTGGAFGYTEEVVPADSEAGQTALTDPIRRNKVGRARNAVTAWERDRTRENRLAAIAALQAVED